MAHGADVEVEIEIVIDPRNAYRRLVPIWHPQLAILIPCTSQPVEQATPNVSEKFTISATDEQNGPLLPHNA